MSREPPLTTLDDGGKGPLASPPPGLCLRCRHARPVTSSRGSTFWRCARSDDDARFPKYPRLPVLECSGFDEPPPPSD